MSLYVLPAIMLQLLMPLFSLVVMAAYLKGFILVAIALVIIVDAFMFAFVFMSPLAKTRAPEPQFEGNIEKCCGY
jgi:hypothetical protein